MDEITSQGGLVDTLRGRTSRRQVLKGGAAVGAAVVWAVPVVEVLTTASASASTPPTTTQPPSTNLSWVDLVFVVPATEGGTPTYYVWSSSDDSFQAHTDGFGNLGTSAFSSFSFYDHVTAGQAQFTGFSSLPQGSSYSISSSYDPTGDLTFTASGTPPTGLVLDYVLVHGGAKAYDSSLTGSAVVAYGDTAGPDTAAGPESLGITVPTGGTSASSNLSGTVANDMQTVTIDGTLYDMSFFVGNT